MVQSFAFISSRKKARENYSKLKEQGLLITTLKPIPHGHNIAFPVEKGDVKLEFEMIQNSNPHENLAKVMQSPPSKWEVLGDVVILPENSVDENEPYDWLAIANAIGGNRLAIQAEISPEMMRKSQLKMLHGKDGWVIHRENFLDYEFDITKSMFSSGNITERRRMGEFKMDGEIVIDAYCGIGYYTIPMLVHGNAKQIHACEINPESIEGLEKGLTRNDVRDQCLIHQGDNRKTMKTLTGIADRIVLGLIPSSESTWKLAIDCLNPKGGIIHIHMNVDERKLDQWLDETIDWFSKSSGKKVTALHLEKVKWYCPHIRHVVLDLKIEEN